MPEKGLQVSFGRVLGKENTYESKLAYTLSSTLFELLAHPQDFQKVKQEISKAVPDQNIIPSYADIENLPYFNAVIQESLRLHPGVMSRMARTSPEQEIVYHDKEYNATYTLPAGTWYSMSTHVTQSDNRYWENPLGFHPQRWIDNPKSGRAFIAFSRGSRNCVG